jgi:very-short-patch-repair endonuclease
MKEILLHNWPVVLFGVLTLIIVALAMFSLREGPLPYERRGTLLNPQEIAFLRSLQCAVREDWLIFPLVRLADIIKVRSKTRKSQAWLQRIYGKHVDFLICDYETLEAKLAIELDDRSQRTSERAQRDRFVNVALAAAGLPLLRVKVEAKYETSVLRKDIEDALGIVRKKKRA